MDVCEDESTSTWSLQLLSYNVLSSALAPPLQTGGQMLDWRVPSLWSHVVWELLLVPRGLLLSVHVQQGREHTSWLPAAGGPGARCEGPGPHGAGGPGHVTKNMEENQKQSEDKSKLDIIVLRSTWTELVKALEPETLLVQLLHRTLTGEQDPRYRTPSLGALSPPGGSERHGLRPGGVDSHPAASCYYRPRERSAAAPSWSNIDLDLH